MTQVSGVFANSPKYVGGISKQVQLDSAAMKVVGASKIGQRISVHAKLHTDGATPAKVRISTSASATSVGNLENGGGRVISTDDEPVEFYDQDHALLVAAQKLYAAGDDVDVFMCSVDGTGECAKAPPLRVKASEAITGSPGASVTVDKPNGTVDGDLMICVVGVDSAAVVPDLAAGWAWFGGSAAAARVLTDDVVPVLRVAYKMAYAEGANYDWGKAASSQTWAAAIMTVRVSQSGGDASKYGIGLTAAIENAKHGTSSSTVWAYFNGEIVALDLDDRWDSLLYQAFGPPLQVVIFGAYSSSTPGDPLASMGWYGMDPAIGGSDIKANEMVGIGAAYIATREAKWEAIQLGGLSHFDFQGCTITLLGM